MFSFYFPLISAIKTPAKKAACALVNLAFAAFFSCWSGNRFQYKPEPHFHSLDLTSAHLIAKLSSEFHLSSGTVCSNLIRALYPSLVSLVYNADTLTMFTFPVVLMFAGWPGLGGWLLSSSGLVPGGVGMLIIAVVICWQFGLKASSDFMFRLERLQQEREIIAK